MKPKTDIYSHDRNHQRLIERIEKSSISQRNKDLIKEFDRMCFIESLRNYNTCILWPFASVRPERSAIVYVEKRTECQGKLLAYLLREQNSISNNNKGGKK